MKTKILLILLLLAGLGTAATEFKSGELINIRTPFLYYGVPTAGATCLLDLYSPTTQLINEGVMQDNSNGWYNYTLIAPTGSENRTNYAGLVKCVYNGENGSTAFDFAVVRNTQDEWSYELNNSQTTANQYLNSINQTISQNTGIQTNINQSMSNLTSSVTQTNSILDRIYYLLNDFFAFSYKEEDHYNFWISSDSNFNDIKQNRLTANSNFDMGEAHLPDGRYYVKVRHYYSESESYGVWSDVVTFTVNNSLS